jgi:hypothetical protein
MYKKVCCHLWGLFLLKSLLLSIRSNKEAKMTFLVSIETTCFFFLVPNWVLWDYWVEVKAEPWPRVIFLKTFDLLRDFDLGTKIKLRSLKSSS